MATAGPNFVGTGASIAATGTITWTNPTNIQGDTTGTAATVSPAANGDTSFYLRCTGFAFSIPTGVTIDGILVEVEQSAANANRHRWHSVKIVDAGAEAGTDQSDASAIPTTKGFKTFGSASNLWGVAFTPAKINASNFGVSFQIDRNAAQATTTSLFRARITVTYHTDTTTTLSATSSTSSASLVRAPQKVISATGQGSSSNRNLASKVLSATGTQVSSFLRNPIHILSVTVSSVSDFATSVIGGTFSTGVAILALSPKPPPISRTEHTIYLKGRITSAGTAHLWAALYESGVNISGDLETGALTTDLVEYALPISDAAAATIDNYTDLEIRMWATSSGARTFEVSEVYLKVPGESNVATITLDALGQGSAIVMRSSIKILSVVGQGSALMIHLPSKIFNLAVSHAISLQRSPVRMFSVIGQTVTTFSRLPSKSLSVVGNTASSLTRVLTRTFSIQNSGSATLLKTPIKAFVAIGQGSSAMTRLALKKLLAVGTPTVTFSRVLSKNFNINTTLIATLARIPTRTFAAIGQGSAVFQTFQAKFASFSVTGQGSASLIRTISKYFSIATNPITTLDRALNKNFAITAQNQTSFIKDIFRTFAVTGQGSAFVDILRHVPVIRGFFKASMRLEGYYRSYITRLKTDEDIITPISNSYVAHLKSDDDIITEGYSKGDIQ